MDEYIGYVDKISNSYANQYTETDIMNNLFDKIDDIYKTIHLDNNRDEYLYNELLLLDINDNFNKLFPVYLEDINTSSPYALERCYTDYDDYDSEINFIDLSKLEEMMVKNSHYQKIINNVINN